MLFWQVPVVLRILVSEGLFQILVKKTVHGSSRERRFLLQYIFCALIAIFAALYLGTISLSITTGVIFLIGFCNGFGAYCFWRAIEINQSKNAIFTIFDDLIAMVLSYIVFQEGQYLNMLAKIGIISSIATVLLFSLNDYYKTRVKGSNDLKLYLYVGFYSVVWGIALFAQKYFGAQHVPVTTFLSSWYAGAILAAMVIFLIQSKRNHKSFFKELRLCWNRHDLLVSFGLALCVIGSVGLAYWAYQLAPQNIIQPIFLVAQMVLPCLIGLYMFGEIKNFDKRSKILLVIGAISGIIVALSY